MATRAASIHLRPVEVSNKQGVFHLHGALVVGQSRQGTGVETASGDNLQSAGGDFCAPRHAVRHAQDWAKVGDAQYTQNGKITKWIE